MKELLEAGVHFGHRTKRWNPKMKDFIFGQRNGIYIIDLQKTIKMFREATDFIETIAAEGKDILIVGTKKQAQDIVKDYALQCEACYVDQRWLGGLLTNNNVIRGSVDKLIEMEEMQEDGRWDLLSKKEQSKQDKVFKKLSKNLGGVKNMKGMPGALIVIDSTKEDIAIAEARKLGIPIVAVVDTNADPDGIDYPIPGNDDAVRAIELFTAKLSEAIMEGKKKRMEKELVEAKQEEEEALKAEAEETEEDKPKVSEKTAEEILKAGKKAITVSDKKEKPTTKKEEEAAPKEKAAAEDKPKKPSAEPEKSEKEEKA
jgi:small subunit ribosomal protein S2